ncbi:hypothetical protein HHL11_16720 [Ramlibacter sp. G-1-2-2]|uniref:Transcriptional regulator n=1 Tax=Ramlibacter agri TaxID=2728837 RepID=A0A848H7B6_9BURK|nr:hypothetical protein [Ramlibacter agri]NML45399.1 hypothetical protein [Ramlibacter agri]
MNKGEVPAEVRRFILTSVPSVPYLEAVLLFRGEPGHAWDAAQLARRLYLPERAAGELLRALAEAGIVADAGDGRLRYAPSSELRAVIDQVAQAYAADLVAITDLIHSRIDRRAQQFADAFRFRKD